MCFWRRRDCRHKFPAFVNEDGYQYCIICGAARKVVKEHVHKWVLINTDTVYAGGTTSENSYPICDRYTYECSDDSCKKIKTQES